MWRTLILARAAYVDVKVIAGLQLASRIYITNPVSNICNMVEDFYQ